VRQQGWFSYPRYVERFLEDLDLHCLAAQQALQFTHPLFEAAQLGRRHDFVIGTGRPPAALTH
jgi:hypothetical protein